MKREGKDEDDLREDLRERTEQVLSKGQDNNTKQGGLDRQHDGLMMIMMMMIMMMTMMTTTMTTMTTMVMMMMTTTMMMMMIKMMMMMMASKTLRAASLVLIYG